MNYKLANLFRELRTQWYYRTIHVYGHERVWETEDQEERREENNEYQKEIFDEETERLIDDTQ